jgi:hypothetical protein
VKNINVTRNPLEENSRKSTEIWRNGTQIIEHEYGVQSAAGGGLVAWIPMQTKAYW